MWNLKGGNIGFYYYFFLFLWSTNRTQHLKESTWAHQVTILGTPVSFMQQRSLNVKKSRHLATTSRHLGGWEGTIAFDAKGWEKWVSGVTQKQWRHSVTSHPCPSISLPVPFTLKLINRYNSFVPHSGATPEQHKRVGGGRGGQYERGFQHNSYTGCHSRVYLMLCPVRVSRASNSHA